MNLTLSAKKPAVGDTLQVCVDVKNTGDIAGYEVVQVYVSHLDARLPQPEKALKAFTKIWVGPNESQKATLVLAKEAFSFYDSLQKQWVCEQGRFQILVGASSADIRLESEIEMQGRPAINNYFDENSFISELAFNERVKAAALEALAPVISKFVNIDMPVGDLWHELPLFLKNIPLIKFVHFSDGKITREKIAALLHIARQEANSTAG